MRTKEENLDYYVMCTVIAVLGLALIIVSVSHLQISAAYRQQQALTSQCTKIVIEQDKMLHNLEEMKNGTHI